MSQNANRKTSQENFWFIIFYKSIKCGKNNRYMFASHNLANLASPISNLIIRTSRKTNATVHKPSINRRSLHYNPITSDDIVVARYRAKNPQTWKVSQRNISTRWKIQLLFHTADLPLIVISPRSIAHLSAEYRISLFTSGKEVLLLY